MLGNIIIAQLSLPAQAQLCLSIFCLGSSLSSTAMPLGSRAARLYFLAKVYMRAYGQTPCRLPFCLRVTPGGPAAASSHLPPDTLSGRNIF